VALAVVIHPAAAEDLERGRALAIGECGACHQVALDAAEGAGPSLIGIVGRPAASQPDYPYSEAMRAAAARGIIWYRDDIKDYLVPGQTYVPDTIMAYPGLDGQAQRDDLVAYLATLKAVPPQNQ
jgi:cytochrome c